MLVLGGRGRGHRGLTFPSGIPERVPLLVSCFRSIRRWWVASVEDGGLPPWFKVRLISHGAGLGSGQIGVGDGGWSSASAAGAQRCRDYGLGLSPRGHSQL